MSAKHFESFQVDKFISWAETEAHPGHRFQFKSPSSDNSVKLYDALLKRADKSIVADGISLPCISSADCKLIPVLHKSQGGTRGFTENYISKLRDDVSGQSGAFQNTALVMIHNSFLDTLINSAENLGGPGQVWSVNAIRDSLKDLVDSCSQSRDVSACLLDYQCDVIQNENATMFGFEPLFDALDDGELEFQELRLFEDPLLLDMDGKKAQIKRRLEENRKLYEDISFVAEHFADQFSNHLPMFGSSFIKKMTAYEDAWKEIVFQEYLDEKKRNAKQGVEFCSVFVTDGVLYERPKSSTKAGQRERHVIIVPNERQEKLSLKVHFKGDGVSSKEVKIQSKNSGLKKGSLIARAKSSGDSWVHFSSDIPSEVSYFSLNLKRDKSSECYKIRCVIIPAGIFSIDNIKNIYLVDVGKQRITLQTDKFELSMSNWGGLPLLLNQNGMSVDTQKYSSVDFSALWNAVETIEFSLQSSKGQVDFCVEGAPADNSLGLPLALNKQRAMNLFDDEYNATVLKAKDRYGLDGCEFKMVGTRAQLLQIESVFVEEKCVSLGDERISLADLSQIDSVIGAAYESLFKYLSQRETLPSLTSWGMEYRSIVARIVRSVLDYLKTIEEGSVLSDDQKKVMKVGMVNFEGETYFSSYHPLVLAYYYELFKRICADESLSFKELPKVTMERLSPRGLLPYVYHPQSGYAFVSTVHENPFWLKVVPQQSANDRFVRKLVADKIEEFLKAYQYLFKNDDAPLLINAVNMHSADELFWGLVRFIKKKKGNCHPIHINFYDDELSITIFDKFNNIDKFSELQTFFESDKTGDKDSFPAVVDALRKRVSYSKLTHDLCPSGQSYAHLTFFKNDRKAELKQTTIDKDISGVSCDGLLCGEASECKENSYFTAFGLRNVDVGQSSALELARMYGLLNKPAFGENEQYSRSSALALAVDGRFRSSLSRSYDSSVWTTIIDPKVTLDFFRSEKDVTLIHYSDQYTSSSSYDAITVTKHVGLFSSVLEAGQGGSVEEFNAFNGTWLLGMLTAPQKIKKERIGIIAAYKFISGLLAESDITWVPLSIAEMIRVSGNIGLEISESDLAKPLHAGRSGAISDDILFVGFKGQRLYLLPVEVKTGAPANYAKAITQARSLLSFMGDSLLGGDCVAHKIYRALFVRQVFMQIDNYQLYDIFEDDYFSPILAKREEWLRGEYRVSKIDDYVEGIVVAHSDSDACLAPSFEVESDVLKVTLPSSCLAKLVGARLHGKQQRKNLVSPYKVPQRFILKDSTPVDLCKYLQAGKEGEELDEFEFLVEDEQPQVVDIEMKGEGESKEINISSVDEFKDPKATPEPESLKVLCGHDEMSSESIFWEPTNTSVCLNPNTGIIGTMGTGKTQFTKSLVAQIVQNQNQNVGGQPIGVLIFDYKSDYVDDSFVQETNARVFKATQLPYNPLSLFGTFAALPALTAEGFAETMSRAFNLGIVQRTKLRSLIMTAYDRFGIIMGDNSTWSNPAPTINDVYQIYLEEEPKIDSLHAALNDLVLFNLFESDSSKVTSLYDLLDGVVVLELAGYPPHIQNLIVALTLDLFYTQMQKQGKPTVQGDFRQLTKLVLVDEADNFMSQNFSALRKILKEGREYGVGTILSTQDITHFKTSENEYASYMQTWIVHRVAKIEGAHTKLVFNISEKAQQKELAAQIGKLDKHQSIFAGGGKKPRIMQDKAFWQLIKEKENLKGPCQAKRQV